MIYAGNPLQTHKGSRIVGTTIYVVKYHMQNVKDFIIHPKYSDIVDTWRRLRKRGRKRPTGEV
jgi:hypothetical protein